ncbi:MAG: T9SS type A sorting domain-containing protein [Bacteroidetes bacterium]|nr:T9SS type A sorting domain-containing protein [Bacteroidota bacterium]
MKNSTFKNYIIIALLFIISNTKAQDTIKIMQYNLLYYGWNTDWCTSTNNNIEDKDASLKKIMSYVKPDIFTVNEMGAKTSNVDHLQNSVLNVNTNKYKHATYTNFSNGGYSYIVNMLYYNSEKLTLAHEDVVTTAIRDINIYKLYYNSSDLITKKDTAFITCIVAHLKAGSDADEVEKRGVMIQTLMDYLNNINYSGNILIMGDFNLYKSTEPAFQTLINYDNPEIKFYDPINQIGSWHNNSYYSNYHTQSTHSEKLGCPSYGGMDDRFDYILMTKSVIDGTNNIQYINGSYHALGQNGTFFNSSLLSSTSRTIPDSIVNALYNMSDHLPIITDLSVNQTHVSIKENSQINSFDFKLTNPVYDKLKLSFFNQQSTKKINVSIISILGKEIFSHNYLSHNSNIAIPFNSIQPGIYFVKVVDEKKRCVVKKFIKR